MNPIHLASAWQIGITQYTLKTNNRQHQQKINKTNFRNFIRKVS